jgi:integrase
MLKQFLKWAGNKQIEAIRWPVRTWARPNADWLDDDVAIAARAAAEGIERILVNLELDLGLRRVEVLRLHVSDFHSGRLSSVHVLGKGRHGGKPRDVHWHPDTPAELEGYLKIRDAVVVKARAKNPGAEDPGNLLVYERGGQILAYKKSALDNFAKRLARRVGKDFSHHTLRRTCGRMMSRAKVNIENIAAVFGHSDTKTTLRYLGLDLEDQRSTMLKYARYQEAVKTVKIPEIGISDESQEKDGPCGI